ncbi:adenylate cyclase, class 2 [Halolactibacillus halophilus]|uniref:Adenylate cyclase, class 2 n=1 Tax=Halolactibacillus halophilus TaxID=306540 RepID=A0A1I5RMP7_9BACI|nr:adenylate cyclase, class 2 [Halolactibacillus halophilus]
MKEVNELLKKVENLGFALLFEKRQIDEYFKIKGLEVEGDVRGSFIYRLRNDSVKGFSAVKKTTIEPGIWEELEINVDKKNLDFIQTLMRDSLSSILTIDKNRSTFKKGAFTLNLDTIKNLGDFIEIELLDENDYYEGKEKIAELILELGIDGSNIIEDGYVTLIKKKNGLL